MSDLPANRSSSFDNISSRILKHNVTLPKSQPVHLKALMLESDEEDDDDEIEEKLSKSETESDSDESLSLSQNTCAKDIPQETPQEKGDTNRMFHSIEGCSKTNPSTQKEDCTDSKGESKLGLKVSSESNVPISNPNREHSHNCKLERLQERHSDMCVLESPKVGSSGRREIDAVHDGSANVKLQSNLSSSSLPYSAHKSCHNTSFDTYKSGCKQMTIGSNMGVQAVQNSSRDNVKSNVVHEEQHEKLRQIVDKVANVQFSVPSSIPQQRQGKKLSVKNKEYLILGCLGRGMCGEVLRVQDLSCGELRAIKCVDLSKMDKDMSQGCLDEISMLRKLQAPCIVKMFDYEIRGCMVYVVMEMGDTDLSRFLRSMLDEKQFSLTMILYYWTEMLTAVKYIHENGVIHSDLKPGNFLLVRGRLKLIDFGIASSINSDMTSVVKNNPLGTLNYISPEALMDIGGNPDSPTHNVKYKISFKSDVWSLGCILYSLVYGYTPFHHIRSHWAKMSAITNPKLNIAFPAHSSASSERLPPLLIDVIRKCLQHDPKARPTVAELLQIEYVPTSQIITLVSPSIPGNILVKIKTALTNEEWRQFIQSLDAKQHRT